MSTTLMESMDSTHNPTVTMTGGPKHEQKKNQNKTKQKGNVKPMQVDS